MRAYLLGYTHGKNDGYYSTLIKYGRCEKSYDESLDEEYVSIDTALEIIDEEQKDQLKRSNMFQALAAHDALENLAYRIKGLRGEEQ